MKPIAIIFDADRGGNDRATRLAKALRSQFDVYVLDPEREPDKGYFKVFGRDGLEDAIAPCLDHVKAFLIHATTMPDSVASIVRRAAPCCVISYSTANESVLPSKELEMENVHCAPLGMVPAFNEDYDAFSPDAPAGQDILRHINTILADEPDPEWSNPSNAEPQNSGDANASDVPPERLAPLDAAARLIAFEGKASYDPSELTLDAFEPARDDERPSGTYGVSAVGVWHALKTVAICLDENKLSPDLAEMAIRLAGRFLAMADVSVTDRFTELNSLFKQGDYRAFRTGVIDMYGAVSGSEGRVDGSTFGTVIDSSGVARPVAYQPRRVAVLVVEDNREQIENFSDSLAWLANKSNGFEVDVVVAGPDAPYEAALQRLRDRADILFAVIDWDLGYRDSSSGTAPPRDGIKLAEHIAAEYPRVDTCILTGRDSMLALRRTRGLNALHVAKADAASVDIVWRWIVSRLTDRMKTPFFDAVREYAGRFNHVLHALPISGARVIQGSGWLAEFGSFYGENAFHGETSATQAPLDSLLSPSGSLKLAEDRAARVFGAQRARFVTNGTSTANKIVHQALLDPGDCVIIDRTCHKSHHYGLAMVGAMPVYVSGPAIKRDGRFLGFCGGISLATIKKALRDNPRARMLCLTNCTFDGHVQDPVQIIEGVRDTLNDLDRQGAEGACPFEDFVFFFDEAWFGYATFCDRYRRKTGMYAANLFPGARVYVTQSTHKTLVAFRQGSMILASDPSLDDPDSGLQQRFEEAVFTHTTTSPSYQIMASLDAGRMWADLDGRRVCQDLVQKACKLRSAIQTDEDIGTAFRIVDNEAMRPKSKGEIEIDQTKITIECIDPTVTGSWVYERLFSENSIQFNKFTSNTFLLILTPGITETTLNEVVSALRGLAGKLKGHRRPSQKPDRDNTVAETFFEKEKFAFADRHTLRDAFFGFVPSGKNKMVKKSPCFLSLGDVKKRIRQGHEVVASRFVIPTPPGFPVLVPGQIIRGHHIDYLISLKRTDIHGMTASGEMPVWTPKKNDG